MTRTDKLLWTVQALLALLFLFAGGMKLLVPLETLAAQSPLPAPFLKFIGVAEVLGAVGLIVPGLTRIRILLTPLAAFGLVIIMIGATALTGSPVPFAVGLLAAFVAFGRRRTCIIAR